jgi:hypothetical protein
MTGLAATVTGATVIAALSTFGDFVWATWIPRHEVVYGLTHGTLLFLSIGLFLGASRRQPVEGAIYGALIGALAAGSFYLLAPIVGFSAMFVAWFGLWLALAVMDAHLSKRPAVRRAVLGRGGAAAIMSGVAFYAISGIWRPFDPQGWDYAVHFGAWTLAYLPGFAALLIGNDNHR